MTEDKRQAIPIDEWKLNNEPISRRRFFKRITVGESKHSLLDTASHTVAFKALALFPINYAAGKMGVKEGNQAVLNSVLGEAFCEKPLETTIDVTITGPLFEEATTRYLPSVIVGEFAKIKWGTGIVSSLVFAVMNNYVGKKTEGEITHFPFKNDILPLTPFVSGLWFWKMLRERGPLHALVSHMTINTIGSAVSLFNCYVNSPPENTNP